MFRFGLGLLVALALLGALPYVAVALVAIAAIKIVSAARRPRYVIVGTRTYGRRGR